MAEDMRSMHVCKILLLMATAGLIACDQTGKAKEGAAGQAGMLVSAASTPAQEKLPEMPDNVVIIASSVHEQFGPEGVLKAKQPGWHAQRPPAYPESLTVDFKESKALKSVSVLRQDGFPARAPKAFRIEVSDDAKNWVYAAETADACAPNTAEGWWNMTFPKQVVARHVRVVITSNCGDTQFLTLRGLQFD